MKRAKRLWITAFATMAMAWLSQPALAQDKVEDFGIFDHLSVGVTLGTTGFGIDLAAPVTNYLQVRAGYDFFGGFSHKEDVKYRLKSNGTAKTEVEGKINLSNAKLLLDVFPFRNSMFRFTTGFYLGTDEIVKIENTQPVSVATADGLLIGDYLVGFNTDGIARGSIKVNKFRPYLGIGVGRSVPRKRIGVSGDLGVMFWGKPSIYEKTTGKELSKSDFGDDGNDFFDTFSKLTVWPVLTVRLCGRIF